MANALQNNSTKEQPLLDYGPFKGIDTYTAEYYVDPSHAVDLLNYVPISNVGSLYSVLGRVNLVTNPPVVANNPTLGLIRFDIFNDDSFYIMASDSVLNTTAMLYSAKAGDANWSALTISAITLTAAQPTYFQQFGASLYGVNGKDDDFKIDASLGVTPIQSGGPTATPSGAAGAAGNLSGSYYYRFTYVGATQETSAGPISAVVTVTNKHVTVTGIPASIPDPQYTHIGLYRLGGTLSVWEEVTATINAGDASFDDNVADQNLGQDLVITRDPPPTGGFYITSHKQRLWIFGQPNDPTGLYFSNYDEGWGWDQTNQYFAVGETTVNDFAQGTASIGSVLMCFKLKTTHAVYGDDPTSFIERKLFDIGCISPRSIISVLGVVFWASADGIWMFDGNTPTRISDGITDVFASLSATDLNFATGGYYQGFYLFGLPTKGITYAISLLDKEIYKIGWASEVMYSDQSVNEVTGSATGASNVYSWFAASTDLGSAIAASWIGKIDDSKIPQGSKQYRFGILIAPVQSGQSATLTLTLNPGTLAVTQAKTISLGTTIRNLWSIAKPDIGYQAQLKIATSSTIQVEIQKVQIYGWPEREFV